MGLLEGKVALVTGATSGIGRAAALGLAREGARVVCVGRRPEEGNKTVAMIKEAGGEAIFVQADTAKKEDTERMVAEAVKAYGKLDVAFNNAGVRGDDAARMHKLDPKDIDYVFNVNIRGTWNCMCAEVEQMLKQETGGSIINTSSIMGNMALGNSAHYVTSKHAIEGMTKAAAVDYAKKGIRINAIIPAVVDTPMNPGWDPTVPVMKNLVDRHSAGRISVPEDLVGGVIFLASDLAGFVHGTSLRVDGGFLSH